ncbi:hypothetical protein K8I85_09525 [bacterium]|nr:hypothetical protein [bacterium]
MEFSGDRHTARLSSVVSALRAAQSKGETTAWVESADGSLYPPDLAEAGVDLAALAVVRIPTPPGKSRGRHVREAVLRATEMLVRTGAFGFVVVDVREEDRRPSGREFPGASRAPWRLPPAWQGRLLGSVRDHGSRIIFLSSHPPTRESVGSLVGLRLEPHRVRVAPGLFAIEHHVLKNKPGLPFADSSETRRGPWGLR